MTPQERAVHYEALYQKYQDQITQLQMIVDQHEEFLPIFKELSDYYSSQVYFDDLDASNSGKIDPNIPQGIYSEDQLYNLFFQHHQVAIQILDLASEMLKQ